MVHFATTIVFSRIPNQALKSVTNSIIHTPSIEIPEDFKKETVDNLSALEIHVNLKSHSKRHFS